MTGLYECDARALSTMSFLRFFPQAVTGGEGAYLFDERGHRQSGFRCLTLPPGGAHAMPWDIRQEP